MSNKNNNTIDQELENDEKYKCIHQSKLVQLGTKLDRLNKRQTQSQTSFSGVLKQMDYYPDFSSVPCDKNPANFSSSVFQAKRTQFNYRPKQQTEGYDCDYSPYSTKAL